MGKPYFEELKGLEKTYAWVLSAKLEHSFKAVSSIEGIPLLAIGSGGSFTAAHIAASLHQRYTGLISKAATPFEAIYSIRDLENTAVMLLSAGGKNPDIIGAFKTSIAKEPRKLVVICLSKDSPLSKLARQYRNVDVLSFEPPILKDGFLATNSLLAYALILSRSYCEAFCGPLPLPITLQHLISPSMSLEQFSSYINNLCEPLWDRATTTVLYGPLTQAAAIDLESKFTEAALGSIQLADYRNFAHGRHHWLAKRGHQTGVLAFITEDDRACSTKTIALIPPEIPVVKIEVPGDRRMTQLSSLAIVFFIVGAVARARQIDPGRPGVPTFGRRIYNLRAFPAPDGNVRDSIEHLAISRKIGRSVLNLDPNIIKHWKQCYLEFKTRLQDCRFQSVVFDYDGTLCDEKDRYNELSQEVTDHLNRLLNAGLIVGVATGRGKSVRKSLMQCLPSKVWSRVLIAYYNGAEIAALSEENRPDGTKMLGPDLAEIGERIRSNHVLMNYCECSFRLKQISIIPRSRKLWTTIWKSVQEIVQMSRMTPATAVISTHSIDIIPPGVSKLNLTEHIRKTIGLRNSCSILCIGDKGQFPGNDFDLLREPFSLSVDESSTDSTTCWNLTPAGHRGVQGTLYYLQSIKADGRTGARIKFD